MELGQMLLSNNNWHRYEADWATDGLRMIAEVISESRGFSSDGWSDLTSNSGGDEFVNNIFEMRSYCWCEGETYNHENGCPPNFLYKKNGLTITWYKHAGRGITANMQYPGARNWFKAISNCIESIQ